MRSLDTSRFKAFIHALVAGEAFEDAFALLDVEPDAAWKRFLDAAESHKK